MFAYLDTDRNTATGVAPIGADYQIALSDLSGGGGHFSFRRWNGTTFEETWSTDSGGDPDDPNVNLNGNVLRFGFATADRFTKSFRFVVTTRRQSTLTLDRTPNLGQPQLSFNMKVVPVRFSISGLTTRPRNPRAGRRFIVTMHLKTSAAVELDPSTSGEGQILDWECAATVARKPLTINPDDETLDYSSGLVSSATVTCPWRIPPGASGKALRGTVTAVYRGRPLVRRFSAKVT